MNVCVWEGGGGGLRATPLLDRVWGVCKPNRDPKLGKLIELGRGPYQLKNIPLLWTSRSGRGGSHPWLDSINRGKQQQPIWWERRRKEASHGSLHHLCIKCSTTTMLAALMTKWHLNNVKTVCSSFITPPKGGMRQVS